MQKKHKNELLEDIGCKRKKGIKEMQIMWRRKRNYGTHEDRMPREKERKKSVKGFLNENERRLEWVKEIRKTRKK